MKRLNVMNKLGVYIATHNNPVFMRHCLLQLAAQRQTRVDVLAIHENNQPQTGRIFWLDVLQRIRDNGTTVIHDVTPMKLAHPFFHYIPLKALYNLECDMFTKFDHDDLFYDDHLSSLEWALSSNKVDFVVKTKADVLILRNKGGFVHKLGVNFGTWNPTGGMSDAIMFTRKVAERYLLEMENRPEKQDDAILADDVLPHFQGFKIDGAPTSCYVSHGKNTSTPTWADIPPAEILR